MAAGWRPRIWSRIGRMFNMPVPWPESTVTTIKINWKYGISRKEMSDNSYRQRYNNINWIRTQTCFATNMVLWFLFLLYSFYTSDYPTIAIIGQIKPSSKTFHLVGTAENIENYVHETRKKKIITTLKKRKLLEVSGAYWRKNMKTKFRELIFFLPFVCGFVQWRASYPKQ